MTHTPGSGGHSDTAALFPSGDFTVGSSYDPTGKPLTERDANLSWIVIVLVIALLGFAVLWLPSLLR